MQTRKSQSTTKTAHTGDRRFDRTVRQEKEEVRRETDLNNNRDVAAHAVFFAR